MPRLVDALPKYRKHQDRGQAVVTRNGRDCHLGPHGTKAAKAFYDRLIAFVSSALEAQKLQCVTRSRPCLLRRRGAEQGGLDR